MRRTDGICTMLFADTSDSVVNLIAAVLSGGGITAIGAFVIKYIAARGRAQTLATSDENKRERAKLDIDAKRMELREREADTADAKNQRAYNDLYEKHLESQKRMDEMQAHILKCEVERAIALTQSAECKQRVEELQQRIAHLERQGS